MQEILDFDRSPLYLAYRLVEEGKIDPWDVDLDKLINRYLEVIGQMELKDLRIPAQIVAFATFLIKKQMEILFPKPPRPRVRKRITLKEIEEEFHSTDGGEFILETRKRVVRKRKTSTKVERKNSTFQGPPLHKAKLEEVLSYLLSLLERLEEGEDVSFDKIATKDDYVAKLWGLLNMAYEGKVVLRQETPFGEIFFSKATPKGEK
ncbi:MAG TPA: segregation/condensation protein A [Aquifex aeolicus]|uniref:Segregation and condensation protein A n=1 Tax=Aquifex aeolicus TaxID=63363 RepID=A0A9D0YMX0_AQUAO|nr:segregation/condensation protein A [Aquifex aeolicus]